MEEHRDTRVIRGLAHLEDAEGLGDWVSSSLSLPRGRRSYCCLQLLSVGVDSLRENISQRSTVIRCKAMGASRNMGNLD